MSLSSQCRNSSQILSHLGNLCIQDFKSEPRLELQEVADAAGLCDASF